MARSCLSGCTLCALVVAIAACDTVTPASADETCEFANDADSCWRSVVRDVRQCLSGASEQGELSDDGLSCGNTSGLRVVFGAPVGVAITPSRLDATIYSHAVVECAHVVADRTTGALTVSGPDSGAVKIAMDGNGRDATVTCPLGDKHKLTGKSVMDVCFAQVMAGGLPAVKMDHDGVSASLAFSGSEWKLYECR